MIEFLLSGLTPGPRAVARHGRPAACVPFDGMPAYESETGALLVMEALVVFPGPPDGTPPMILPRSYMLAALRAPTGLTALHDDPDAVWSWRPVLYRVMLHGVDRLGSQQELEWRQGLFEAEMSKADLIDDLANLANDCAERGLGHKEYAALGQELIDAYYANPPAQLPFTEANERARRVLREHLNPQQQIDLDALGRFYVRGTINRLYSIQPGHGANIVNPETREGVVSLCVHPDDWIPHDDVSLSLKMMIESGLRGEEELLAGARATPYPRSRPAEESERRAWRIERGLLPAPFPAESRDRTGCP